MAPPESLQVFVLAQQKFFRQVDAYKIVDTTLRPQTPAASDDAKGETTEMITRAHSLLTMVSKRPLSHTYVLEAAFYLIRNGCCHVRGKDVINVKWARTLLHFAVWVQLKMSRQWVEKKLLQPQATDLSKEQRELFAMDGEVCKDVDDVPTQAAIFFLGVESIRKAAPTNTAARVLGGRHLSCNAQVALRQFEDQEGTSVGRGTTRLSKCLERSQRASY